MTSTTAPVPISLYPNVTKTLIHIAKLKASVLRIEKNFGQSVVEPLKNAMINRSTPDFPNLKVHATHCQEQILPTSELWREEVGRVILKIMGELL